MCIPAIAGQQSPSIAIVTALFDGFHDTLYLFTLATRLWLSWGLNHNSCCKTALLMGLRTNVKCLVSSAVVIDECATMFALNGRTTLHFYDDGPTH